MEKQDLLQLPRHIIKLNKHWFKNTKDGKWIRAERITDYLPKPVPNHDAIVAKRYDLRAD